ncbi:MAG: hypothetical protein ACR2KQ_08250 [Actinomycetota bacterium]
MTPEASDRRLIERLADPTFLEGLSELPIERLRVMREECREAEMELSFERRLCQARIDILAAELDRRAGRGGEGDLMSRLPEILATESNQSSSPLPSRAPDLSVPRNADVPRRRVDEIAGERTLSRMATLPDEEVEGILASLKEWETGVSARRKVIQEVMDKVQAEVVRRYKSGASDPADLFETPR